MILPYMKTIHRNHLNGHKCIKRDRSYFLNFMTNSDPADFQQRLSYVSDNSPGTRISIIQHLRTESLYQFFSIKILLHRNLDAMPLSSTTKNIAHLLRFEVDEGTSEFDCIITHPSLVSPTPAPTLQPPTPHEYTRGTELPRRHEVVVRIGQAV